MSQSRKSNESWPSKFLNTGTEKGLGDLSMMIGTVSEIINTERERAVEEEREKNTRSIFLAVHRTVRKHAGDTKCLVTLLNDPAMKNLTPPNT
jgi:hypothetical protein